MDSTAQFNIFEKNLTGYKDSLPKCLVVEVDSNRFNIYDKNWNVFNWIVVLSSYNRVFNNILCLFFDLKPGWPKANFNTILVIYTHVCCTK